MHGVSCGFILLLFFVLLNASIIPVPPTNCPFSRGSENSSSFYSKPENAVAPVCSRRMDKTCCKDEYFAEIQNGTDLVTTTFNNFLVDVPDGCLQYVHKLACAPCEADSGVWSESVGLNDWILTLCNGFCDAMYSACKDATVITRGRPVSQSFSSGLSFCSSMFQTSDIIATVRPNNDHVCYDPNDKVCTSDDIIYHYTDCISSKRELLYNWNTDSNCTGGTKIPESKSGLICPIDCDAGTYLPLGGSFCLSCPAGTFSLGGGYRVHEWDTWPDQILDFRTYCTTNNGEAINSDTCSGWSLNSTYIDSNIAGRNNTKSVLEVIVQLNHDGSVAFTAQVDAEFNFDILTFSIDSSKSEHIPNSFEAVTYRRNLTAGYHTLRWTYSKDGSLNFGLDHAIIYMIEVTALSEHSDFCTECLEGTISQEGATDCTKCPFNTKNPVQGSSVCIPCSDDEYAHPGSADCIPRQPCTEDDMQALYTPCDSNHQRNRTWSWVEPRICKVDNVTLPPIEVGLECAPCNPGEYRLGPDCMTCAPGTWSSLGTEYECDPCPAGSYAPKQFNVHTWDELPPGFETHCEGECGTDGWRVRGTYIDSGEDHGSRAYLTLHVNITISAQPYGLLYYDFLISCDGWCYLELYDGNTFIKSDWFSRTDPSRNYTTNGPFKLTPGTHSFTWTFAKFFSQRNRDRALISKITIQGVEEGGAGECLSCPSGTFSTESTDTCRNCSAGQYSNENSTECLSCPENTYQDKSGQGVCKLCGPGTNTPAGSTECNSNCTFTDQESQKVYDLNGLSKSDSMWGPINEDPHIYYINPCRKNVTNATCFDENGKSVNSYACQIQGNLNWAVDLGSVMGFSKYSVNESEGVVVIFTDGDPACGSTFSEDVPRSLNLTIICDPQSGRGNPESARPIDHGNCTYSMIWKSIYGCPLCTTNDYSIINEVCVDGKQTIRYEWNENPKRCHDGVQLPSSFTRNCSTTITCGTGEQLNSEDTCEKCKRNQFSVGAGEIFAIPPVDLNQFTILCYEAPCEGWKVGDDYLQSGTKTSQIELSRNFQNEVDSSIQFSFSYMGHGSPFRFFIDSVQSLSVNTAENYGYITFHTGVSIGTHVFRWEFEDNLPTTNYVRIKNIIVNGTTNSVPTCRDCPPGMIVNEDKGMCTECPVNTFVQIDESGNPSCQPCPEGQYRLLGQGSNCHDLIPCSNYVETIPPSSGRCGSSGSSPVATIYKTPLSNICKGNPQEGKVITSCIPCPLGTVYSTQQKSCQPCPSGQYLQGEQCVNAEPGNTAIKASRYFFPNDVYDGIPSGFTTDCYGSCSDSDGWELIGSTMYSKINFGEVVSVLSLKVDMDPEFKSPEIQYTTALHDARIISRDDQHKPPVLEVYVNGQLISYDSEFEYEVSASRIIELPAAPSLEIKFIYNQDKSSVPSYITLHNLTVAGAKNGGAISQVPCPAGTHESNSLCIPCEPGTYTDTPKNTKCKTCPESTVSDTGATQCYTCGRGTTSVNNKCVSTCTFKDDLENEYVMTNFRELTFPVLSSTASYELHPCTQAQPKDCVFNSCKEDGYVFAKFIDEPTSSSFTLGTRLEFHPLATNQNTSMSFHSFDLVFTGGSNLPNGCEEVKTTIQFFCDPREGKSTPNIVSESKCNNVFSWNTLYACRMCFDNEVLKEKQVCQDGKRSITKRLATACHYTGDLSEVEYVPCKDIEVEFNTAIIGVSVAGGILLLVVGCAIYCYWSKKNLEAKYEILKNEANLGDTALGDSNDEDDQVRLEELGENHSSNSN